MGTGMEILRSRQNAIVYNKNIGGPFVVIPAHAGIQNSLYFLDSGSRPLQPEADPPLAESRRAWPE